MLTFRVKLARHKISMFLLIDVQNLFHTNSAEIIHYFLLFCYFELFVILLNFEKQFQKMMNKFKIKPIRFRVNFTSACLALTHFGQMSPNSQVLGHQTILTITLFTGNQSQVVTELLRNKLIIITFTNHQSGCFVLKLIHTILSKY